jgi:hypothetical protein
MEDLSSKIKKQSRDQVLGHVWANTRWRVGRQVRILVQDKTREQIQWQVQCQIQERVDEAIGG